VGMFKADKLADDATVARKMFLLLQETKNVMYIRMCHIKGS